MVDTPYSETSSPPPTAAAIDGTAPDPPSEPDGPQLRVFGTDMADIEIDLSTGPRPELVTRLLMNSLTGVKERVIPSGSTSTEFEESLWNLTVGDRISRLILLTFHDEPIIPLTLACPREGCGESMEVPVERHALLDLQRDSDQRETVQVTLNGESIILRKPTGRDQKQWLTTPYTSEEEAVRTMITMLVENDQRESSDSAPDLCSSMELDYSACVGPDIFPTGSPDLTPEWIDAINTSMEDADPLVNFAVSVTCPSCGHGSSQVVDLEALALSRLREKQIYLFRTVHTLASHYHWTEREVLSLPQWRRSHYLSLIGGQKTV